MTTTDPTPHQLLEVSAAIGADTGKWKHAYSVWYYLQPDYNGEIQRWEDYEATPDELDAQVGRLVKRLTRLGWVGSWDHDVFRFDLARNGIDDWATEYDADYNTAVYLAACKVRDSK